jgi:lysine N6-hydroxylase
VTRVHDLVGIGIGPFNLALAALADGQPDVDARFFERADRFAWHPGLMLDGARLQVPFLADLVSLVDPTSRWSFLAYLRDRDRLFPFYFSERFHIPRREYDDYCRWVAGRLPSCSFGSEVRHVEWDTGREAFRVVVRRTTSGDEGTVLSRNVVLGIGTAPTVPAALSPMLGRRAFHAAEYLDRRSELAGTADVTVVGSGQSGAEVFLELLRDTPPGVRHLRWLTASRAFAPMEYSKLGLEHFTPDYTRYFHGLPPATRDRLVPEQWQLHKAISAETIADIQQALYERSVGEPWREDAELRPCLEVRTGRREDAGFTLVCRERLQDRTFEVRTDAVVLATGYAPRRPDCLSGLERHIRRDRRERMAVDHSYRVELDPEITGGLYVQNAEQHTHGVGAPDLGLGAHRGAVILNAVAGREVHRLPRRTAFTSFGAPE